MLSFAEIENCFPDGSSNDDATGKTLVSAQWLHDFAHAIAAVESNACAKVLRDKHDELAKRSYPAPMILLDLESEILERSTENVNEKNPPNRLG